MEGGRIVQTGAPEDIVLKPADDYVRDFIANVNPLSVLTAWNVMRDRRELEQRGGRLGVARPAQDDALQDRRPRAGRRPRSCNGKTADMGVLHRGRRNRAGGVQRPSIWARPGTSLKTVMLAMHKSGTAPVALFDDNDRFVGSIGVRNVLQAILRRGG